MDLLEGQHALSDQLRAVSLLQKHIDQGRPQKCAKCPAALALFDATGLEWHVFETIIVSPDGRRGFLVSPELRQFISDFDAGNPVSPITFDFPEEYFSEGSVTA